MVRAERVPPGSDADDEYYVDPRNRLNELSASDWIQETKSFWFQKGLGASHPDAQIERLHPAPFSYQDVQRLIEFFTKPGQLVVDPFVGVGSTLKAAALSKRRGVGIEVTSRWVELARERIRREVPRRERPTQKVIEGDSRETLADKRVFPEGSVDFVVTSPPYWSILNKKADHKVSSERVANGLATNYSEDARDLGNIDDYETFLDEVCRVFTESHRVLKEGGYLAVIVGDFRHGSTYYAYHADLIQRLSAPSGPFTLQGVTVLLQNHKRLFPYGYPYAYVPNVHHQNILLFRK